MAAPLKRLLARNRRAVALLLAEAAAAMGSGICIQDAGGAILLGERPAGEVEKFPVESGGETLGWVMGSGAQALAHWLGYLSDQAGEIEALADEALSRYREVNLLYTLSAKLTTSLDPQSVCGTALEEARRLIQASAGGVLLLDDAGESLRLATGFGEIPGQVALGEGVIGACAQSARAEVVNAVEADPRRAAFERVFGALLCAPLETSRHLLGVLVLASETADVYAAGDLKLLNTLAAQSAPIIEHALLHEKTLQEAKARETRLEQQIEALRIELDESRQAKKVAEITETDYFKNLLQQADGLRHIIDQS